MNCEQKSFKIISKNSDFCLEKNGWTFNLSPPEMIKISFPPDVEGLDWFVKEARILKNISSKTMNVDFSTSFFLGCDANLEYSESSFGGWIYSIENESLNFNNYRRIWICSQMKLYFENPPKKIFILIEEGELT